MSETLKSLNIKRGSLKGKLSRIKVYLSTRKFKRESIEEIKAKQVEIEAIYTEYQTIQEKIDQFIDDDTEEAIFSKAEEFEIQYQSLMSDIEEVLDKLENQTIPDITKEQVVVTDQTTPLNSRRNLFSKAPSQNDSDSEEENFILKNIVDANVHQDSSANPSTSDAVKIQPNRTKAANPESSSEDRESARQFKRIRPKLPEFKLPNFTGKVDEWIAFRDSFESLIHSATDMNNIDKFNYLLSCLGDAVKEEIAGYRLSSENYPLAWQALRNRYDDEKVLIQTHLDKLFECPAASSESEAELRRILNCYKVNLAQLQSSCPNSVYWDAIVIHMIKQRIDLKSRRALEMSCENSVGMTWKQMQSFLEKRCRYLEQIRAENPIHNSSNPSAAKSTSNSNKTASKPETKVVLMAMNSYKPQCNVCREEHFTYVCPQINTATISDRIQKLKLNNLCFNCLHPNHSRQSCRNPRRCHICQGNHNTIIHEYFETEKGKPKDQAKKTETETKENTKVETPKVTAHCAFAGSKDGQVFLSTAVVVVDDQLGNTQFGRVLLDNGAQSCFMTERFASKLKFKRKPVNIRVSGLNKEPIIIKHSIQAQITSRMKNYSKAIEFFLIPSISERIPCDKSSIPKIEIPDEKLADPDFHIPSEVDLLIGAEHFLDLLQEGRIPVADTQMFFKNSVFGWIAAGKIENEFQSTVLTQVESRKSEAAFLNLKCEDVATLQLKNHIENEMQVKRECPDSHTLTSNSMFTKHPIRSDVQQPKFSHMIAMLQAPTVKRFDPDDRYLQDIKPGIKIQTQHSSEATERSLNESSCKFNKF